MSAPLLEDDPQNELIAPNASQKTEIIEVALEELQPAPSQPTPDPPSEWEALRAQVRSKPSDSDSWLKLVDIAIEDGDFDRINETYEALLEAYPNTVRLTLVARVTCI